MTAQSVPPPSFGSPITDGRGIATVGFRAWLTALYQRTGAQADKVDAAHAMASAAVPQTTQVVTGGGAQGGGALGGNVVIALYKAIDALDNLPTTGLSSGDMAYVLDGRKAGEGANAGTGIPAFWSKGNWYSVGSGAVVTT
ncbi:MAG TPA: hypothetical protein VII63_08530 [Caulobacteraceae bacterium]